MKKRPTLQQKYNEALQENRRLKALAYQDDLTGLPNNRAFEQAFSEAIGKAQPFALLFLDVDNFGQLNKIYSHYEADEVVRQIAQRIEAGIRRGDQFTPAKQTLVARYAGDEFFVLLSQTDAESAFQVAERLRRKIQRSTYYLDEERTHKLPQKITVSIGAAVYPLHGLTESELRNSVEKALQIAKKQGKAQVALAPAPKHTEERHE